MEHTSLKEKIKTYLYVLPYHVLHEDHGGQEVFFILINKSDISDMHIQDFWQLYEQTYGLKNISPNSVEFIKKNKNNFFAVWVDTIKLSDIFFETKKKYIINNANNIISLRVLGVAADVSEHMEHVALNAIEQATQASIGTAGILAEGIKLRVKNGLPSLKNKIKAIENRFLR